MADDQLVRVIATGKNGYVNIVKEFQDVAVPKVVYYRGLQNLWRRLLGKPLAYQHPTETETHDFVASAWVKTSKDPRETVKLRLIVKETGDMQLAVTSSDDKLSVTNSHVRFVPPLTKLKLGL